MKFKEFSSDRFTVINPIGHGSYGVVYEAVDNENDEHQSKLCAVKKILGPGKSLFVESTPGGGHNNLPSTTHYTLYRELQVLSKISEIYNQYDQTAIVNTHNVSQVTTATIPSTINNSVSDLKNMPKHKNLIYLRDLFANYSEGSIYFTFDYMPFDLNGLRYAKLSIQDDFTIEQIRSIAYQLLSGLSYLHDQLNIVHRDVKPGNILIDFLGVLKITDFGLCRKFEKNRIKMNVDDEELAVITGQICTIWYRPIDLLLNDVVFSKRRKNLFYQNNLIYIKDNIIHSLHDRIDIYSAGIVLADCIVNNSLMNNSETPLSNSMLHFYHGQNTEIDVIRKYLIEFNTLCLPWIRDNDVNQDLLSLLSEGTSDIDGIVDHNFKELICQMCHISPINRPTASDLLSNNSIFINHNIQGLFDSGKKIKHTAKHEMDLTDRGRLSKVDRKRLRNTFYGSVNDKSSDPFEDLMKACPLTKKVTL